MKSRIIVMVVAFWGMTAIWAQDSTPWYMGTWNRHQPNPKAKDMPLVQIDGNHFVTPDGNTILFRGPYQTLIRWHVRDIGTKSILQG